SDGCGSRLAHHGPLHLQTLSQRWDSGNGRTPVPPTVDAAPTVSRPVDQDDLGLQLVAADRAEVAAVGRGRGEVALHPELVGSERPLADELARRGADPLHHLVAGPAGMLDDDHVAGAEPTRG